MNGRSLRSTSIGGGGGERRDRRKYVGYCDETVKGKGMMMVWAGEGTEVGKGRERR